MLRDYERRQRQRTYRRMLAALRKGTPPERISGDRDVLQAALETWRKEGV